MKYRIAFIFILAVIAITGCTEQSDMADDKATAFSEKVDLEEKIASGGMQTKYSLKYELTATISLRKDEDADRIVYEYFIKKSKNQ
ncbi:hypothetical protein H8B09_06600 [Paenibacillus sp. PR3]|uniref:Lipoprotein n=1 Tax=Paenibacillus terricola TaxID=2763503 RepID=A0ABR8MV70_9BACL|nr:hypothetical protein [Paenibacillus terricola]MBD3918419.1 hypothetical protein [Paenibacillus terricola]